MLVVTCEASHIVQLQSVGGVGAMRGPVIYTLEAAPTGLEPDLSLDSQSQAEEIVTVMSVGHQTFILLVEGIKYNPLFQNKK